MAAGQKCYCCGIAETTDELFYCYDCLQKMKIMFDNNINVIEHPMHQEHCISCGEWENRRIVYPHQATFVCDRCVEREMKKYKDEEVKRMLEEAFPKTLNHNFDDILNVLPVATVNNVCRSCSDTKVEYKVENFHVKIPYRIYLLEPDDTYIDSLNDEQKLMLYCIYTRSSNGYLREKFVRKVLENDFKSWCLPFVVKLCDEYVVEIMEAIYDSLKERENEDIKVFCLDNKEKICKGYARMTSYWNEFYRDKEYCFRNYIGRTIFKNCFGYSRSFEK